MCHWLEFDSFVRFQKLGVNDNSGLSDKVSWVRVNVFIVFNVIDNPQEAYEKVTISAVVKALQVFFNFR